MTQIEQSQPSTTTVKPSLGATRWKKLTRVLLVIFLVYCGVACFHSCLKPLPTGLSLEGEPHQLQESDVEFLFDVTSMNGDQRVVKQVIYDRVLSLIRGADDFVLVDLFLFNDYLGNDRHGQRRLCDEVTQALLEKKRNRPAIRLVVITDPVNEAYGGSVLRQFEMLRNAEIPVVLTDLRRLRDSNPVYSGFWRMFVQWFGSSPGGRLPHPFAKDAPGVGLRSWLALLNFKANHRKLIVADAAAIGGARQLVSMVMSANPHDGSSAHHNAAVLVYGGIWKDLLKSEQAILDFSGTSLDLFTWLPPYVRTNEAPAIEHEESQKVTLKILTEEKIRQRLLQAINAQQNGDAIDLAMFYLAERSLIKAIEDAAHRGVSIRLLLDPNRDAFGYQKNGIPNRPAAMELMAHGQSMIKVRWADTHGEQFHTKMVLFRKGTEASLFTGSANITRRNIGDFNLETEVVVSGQRAALPLQAAAHYFEMLWTNQEHAFTVPYEAYAETSRWKYWLYRLQERSGMSTF
jgi:phosphatidylserine/phosphatidylglycerophosphate/cardiolipin synthase-like enzyme